MYNGKGSGYHMRCEEADALSRILTTLQSGIEGGVAISGGVGKKSESK